MKMSSAKAPIGRSARAQTSWLRALGRYYGDPAASLLGKLVALFAVVYAVMPLDLIPDVPVVGWLDDIGVMGLATWWLMRAVARYRERSVPELGSDVRNRNDYFGASLAGISATGERK
jgi:uncharacterized membrane protein YkvA (DUF1232 family)